MQHVNMERVTLDPLATVDEPTQSPELAVNLYAERVFDRVYGAHLIGDGTDSADASDNVGDFGEVPAAEKGFEKARRLVDLQLYILNLIALEFDVESAFALDSG
jgi:hypothetical protein